MSLLVYVSSNPASTTSASADGEDSEAADVEGQPTPFARPFEEERQVRRLVREQANEMEYVPPSERDPPPPNDLLR